MSACLRLQFSTSLSYTYKVERVMSLAEIEQEFGGEWMLLVEPEPDNTLKVLNGKVAYLRSSSCSRS